MIPSQERIKDQESILNIYIYYHREYIKKVIKPIAKVKYKNMKKKNN